MSVEQAQRANEHSSSRCSTAMKPSGASGPRLTARPVAVEIVPLDAALGRVLAADVVSPVDVPSFDRSNVDGFAVVAEDTFGASEEVSPPCCARRGRDPHRRRSDDRDSARQSGTDCHGRHGAARRRCRCHGGTRRGPRRRTSHRPGPSQPAAEYRLPEPISPRARPCFAAANC